MFDSHVQLSALPPRPARPSLRGTLDALRALSPASAGPRDSPEHDEELLALRASFSGKELELLELQREHAALAGRLLEAQENYEEALEVKDRTIEQLATALRARDEALERHLAAAKSLKVSARADAAWVDCAARGKAHCDGKRSHNTHACSGRTCTQP